MSKSKEALWVHPDFKGTFNGNYVMAKNDRVHQLSQGGKVITFDSWQQTKKAGWKKQRH